MSSFPQLHLVHAPSFSSHNECSNVNIIAIYSNVSESPDLRFSNTVTDVILGYVIQKKKKIPH